MGNRTSNFETAFGCQGELVDGRFQPTAIDCKRDIRVYLHPKAEMEDIRNGIATDAIDLSPFVSGGTEGLFETSVTLSWNNELFGASQPIPNQILEIQENGLTTWMGIIESISSYRLSRGERSMEVQAKTRDSLNLWRETKLVTNSYPLLTNLSSIASDVAKKIGLYDDEILIPATSISTSHSNTQIAGLSAWDCFSTLFTPMGLTPFVDCLGRLRGASRDLNNRASDIVVGADRIESVDASRVRAPTTRVRVLWLDPKLSKSIQTGRKLGEATITTGWFVPYIQKEIWFSQDKTQRAENTYLRIKQSANSMGVPVCLELYDQTSQGTGEIRLINLAFAPLITLMILKTFTSALIPDWVFVPVTGGFVPTVSVGRKIEGLANQAVMMILMSVGTGVYEIWGNPFDWVHARNTTEAFDENSPGFIDNPIDIETDFVMSESHAQDIAVRELIYRYNEQNAWSITVIEDKRIEFGDILEFPDGTRMYVLDRSRPIARDSEALMSVKGFLLGTPQASLPQTGTGTYTVSGRVTNSGNPISNVVIVLTGSINQTTITDTNGDFTFTGLPNGSYEVAPQLIGYNFSPSGLVAVVQGADVTGENFLGVPDAQGTHNISGTITGASYVLVSLSGGASSTVITDASGNYEFSGLPSAGTYTLTPNLNGYIFTPASITVTLNNGSVTGENFVATIG